MERQSEKSESERECAGVQGKRERERARAQARARERERERGGEERGRQHAEDGNAVVWHVRVESWESWTLKRGREGEGGTP